MSILAFVIAGWIFLVGVYGIVTSRHLVHTIVCLAVCQSSTYVFLLAIGYRKGGTAPLFSDASTSERVVDPVVQALALTDIVVGATVTALLLALAIQVNKRHGTADPDQLPSMEQ